MKGAKADIATRMSLTECIAEEFGEAPIGRDEQGPDIYGVYKHQALERFAKIGVLIF